MKKSWKDKLVYEIKDWILWISLSVIIATVVGSALSVALDTGTPLMAVMSTSMVHDSTTPSSYYLWMQDRGFDREQLDSFPVPRGFDKGDVVVVQGQEGYDVGDVIVYHVYGQPMPIVHRIISINGTKYETKGDHNPIADPWEADVGKIEGKVVLVVPYVGFIKVLPMEALAWVIGK